MLAARYQQRRRNSFVKCQDVMHALLGDVRSSNTYRSRANKIGRHDFFKQHQRNAIVGVPPSNLRVGQIQQNGCSIRFFSKFSTDEVVVKDSDSACILPANSSADIAHQLLEEEGGDATKPSIDVIRPATSKMRHLLALKESYVKLSKMCIDAQALLKSNIDASTPDELVAMVDYFLILVNDVDLETSIETIQTLQYNEELLDSDSVTKEVLEEAQKALIRLHNIFLKVVEFCIPPTSTSVVATSAQTATNEMHSASFVPTSTKYSALTTGRALQVSHRAEELGLPMHKPLYQRMAVGIVLTSPLPLPMDPGQWPWESSDENMSDEKLVISGHSQQVKEGLCTPPLSMELLNLCHRAKVAMKCSFSPSMPLTEQLEKQSQQYKLEVDMYSEPWLLMLRRRQFKEALGLLKGWESGTNNGQAKPTINLLALFGEDTVCKALGIAKDWVEGSTFPNVVSSDRHANELIELLQQALSVILRRRKYEADQMANLVDALTALQRTTDSENTDDDFSDSDSDLDDDVDDFEFDSDDEEDEDTVLEELSKGLATGSFPLLLKGIGFDKDLEIAKRDNNEIRESTANIMEVTRRTVDTDSPEATELNPTPSTQKEEEDKEPPLIQGLNNDEVRRSIYLRKGPDWELPDVVPQLQNWNKGNSLSFTPEFERHLGWQLIEDDEDYWSK